MATLKSKRKASDFEVLHSYYKLRREVTDLLFRDFGFTRDQAERLVQKKLGSVDYEELSPENKTRYDKLKAKYYRFFEWYIPDARQKVVDYITNIGAEIVEANSIYPKYMEELIERRIHQDKAIGWCNWLTQEIQYVIETLPIDINKYTRFDDMIANEIKLIKGWRKADNKLKNQIEKSSRAASVSSANFANVNSNGNANYNGASNSNGVRPDFELAVEEPIERSTSKKGDVVLPYEQ